MPPVVLFTLAINLLFGNLYISMLDKDKGLFYFTMVLCFSLPAIFFLLGSFRLITPDSRWWTPLFLGVFLTMLVPFAGMLILGFLLSFPEQGLLIALGKGIVSGIFGLFGGAAFAVPFVFINTIAFFLYWHNLRSTPQLAVSGSQASDNP